MSDSHQAIYDAVRSRIHNGDVGSVVSEAARNAFDISWAVDAVKTELICGGTFDNSLTTDICCACGVRLEEEGSP